MSALAIQQMELRAAALAARAALQRDDIHRRIVANLTRPATLGTVAALGAVMAWQGGAPRAARRLRGSRAMRTLSFVTRYSGPLLSLAAWLVPTLKDPASVADRRVHG